MDKERKIQVSQYQLKIGQNKKKKTIQRNEKIQHSRSPKHVKHLDH